MGSVGAERRRPTLAETPEERDMWRAGWREAGREGWREGRDSGGGGGGGGVVQSYSFDSYQLEEEEISKDAPERGVLALSEPGEGTTNSVCLSVRLSALSSHAPTETLPRLDSPKSEARPRLHI